MMDRRGLGGVKATGMMVVHGPAAVGDQVFKAAFRPDVVLGHDIVPHIPPGLPFARKNSDPVDVKIPIAFPIFRVIFQIVPQAVGQPQQLIPQFFGIPDRVLHSAQFQVPKILPIVM